MVYYTHTHTAYLHILPHSHILISSQGKQEAPNLTLHHLYTNCMSFVALPQSLHCERNVILYLIFIGHVKNT